MPKKFLIPALSLILPFTARAATQLPSYMQSGSDLASTVNSKGSEVTQLVSLIVVALAVIGMLIGGGYFAVGRGEEGKRYLLGGVIAVIIAGAAYSIASFFAS